MRLWIGLKVGQDFMVFLCIYILFRKFGVQCIWYVLDGIGDILAIRLYVSGRIVSSSVACSTSFDSCYPLVI